MGMKALWLLVLIALGFFGTQAFGEGPDCSGGWPTNMTFVNLKNARMIKSGEIDFSKTRSSRIASEKIGKDLYRQVYDIRFTDKSGNGDLYTTSP
jgi:hypothetical protein